MPSKKQCNLQYILSPPKTLTNTKSKTPNYITYSYIDIGINNIIQSYRKLNYVNFVLKTLFYESKQKKLNTQKKQ